MSDHTLQELGDQELAEPSGDHDTAAAEFRRLEVPTVPEHEQIDPVDPRALTTIHEEVRAPPGLELESHRAGRTDVASVWGSALSRSHTEPTRRQTTRHHKESE